MQRTLGQQAVSGVRTPQREAVDGRIKSLHQNTSTPRRKVIGKILCGERAAALGEKIRVENGLARAVEVIEQHAYLTAKAQ